MDGIAQWVIAIQLVGLSFEAEFSAVYPVREGEKKGAFERSAVIFEAILVIADTINDIHPFRGHFLKAAP